MTGPLNHSPADIIREILIDLSQGTHPDDNGSWPIYATFTPDTTDNLISVVDTEGDIESRTFPDGEVQERPGIKVLVRCTSRPTGYAKANAVAIALDGIFQTTVTVGGTSYEVHSVQRVGSVNPLGTEPGTRRNLFSINCRTLIRQS